MRKIISLCESFLSKVHTLLNNKNNIIGRGSLIYYKSRIINKNKSQVIIGENCDIGRSKYGYHAGMPFYTTILNDGKDSYVKIGNKCRLNGVYIHSQKLVEIGDKCVVASNVQIIDSNGHNVISTDRTYGRDKPEEIIIGNNVWIGVNVVILKGTKIGDNSVVAAGTIVQGSFPNNSLIKSVDKLVVEPLKINKN